VPHAKDPRSLDDTLNLRKIAPTFADWPRWMRKLPTIVFWTGITILFGGASALFWRTIAMGSDAALIHHDLEELESSRAEIKELSKDMAVVKAYTLELKRWKDRNECEAEEDLRRRHHLPPHPCEP
jgi:hypothetical protein